MGQEGAVFSMPLGPWSGGQYLSSSVGWATASFRHAMLASDTRLSDARESLVSARRVMKRCARTSSWEEVGGQRLGATEPSCLTCPSPDSAASLKGPHPPRTWHGHAVTQRNLFPQRALALLQVKSRQS